MKKPIAFVTITLTVLIELRPWAFNPLQFSKAFADPSCNIPLAHRRKASSDSAAVIMPSDRVGSSESCRLGMFSKEDSNFGGDTKQGVSEEGQSEEEGNNNEGNQKKQEQRSVVAQFVAVKTISTPVVPLPESHNNGDKGLDEFFEHNRNLLFSAGAKISDVYEPTPEAMKIFWSESSTGRREAGFSETDEKAITKIIQLVNPSMQFIGVKLLSVVTVGTQLLKAYDENGVLRQDVPFHPGYPEYQFTLLETTFQADGPRPLVWLFNKLMGIGKKDKDKSDTKNGMSVVNGIGKNTENEIATDKAPAQKTSGFTRVWAEPYEGGMRFHVIARLESQLRIPRLMIRLLPFSIDKMEEQGSAALQKAVEKDINPAMERFREAYLEWIVS